MAYWLLAHSPSRQRVSLWPAQRDGRHASCLYDKAFMCAQALDVMVFIHPCSCSLESALELILRSRPMVPEAMSAVTCAAPTKLQSHVAKDLQSALPECSRRLRKGLHPDKEGVQVYCDEFKALM